MKNIKLFICLGVVMAALVVLPLFLYTVSETTQVVITQFGQPKRVVKDAGLHFKMPFVEQVNVFDKRILEWDGNPTQVPTLDKKYIWVDSFARWRIKDPLMFFKTVSREETAHGRLDDIINGAVRNQISNHLLIEAVRTTNRKISIASEGDIARERIGVRIEMGRDEITRQILAVAMKPVAQLGIELVDIRFKRINYVEQVRQSVYERMITERKQIAAKYRSEGEGQKLEIEGRKEKEEKVITSGAYRTAQEIMGKADAKAIRIYAEAYSKDPEFYSFQQTLKSYEENVGPGTVMILSSNGEYFKYLNRRDDVAGD